jgi:hypothetical protein
MRKDNVTPHDGLSTLGPDLDTPECEPQRAPVSFPADIDPLETALRRMDAAAERLQQDTRRALDKIEQAFANYVAAVNSQDAADQPEDTA